MCKVSFRCVFGGCLGIVFCIGDHNVGNVSGGMCIKNIISIFIEKTTWITYFHIGWTIRTLLVRYTNFHTINYGKIWSMHNVIEDRLERMGVWHVGWCLMRD